MWDDELDDVVLAELHGAYVRRKAFEAKLIANEIVNALGKALNGGKGNTAGRHNVVDNLDSFVTRMGSKWQ